MSRLSDEWRKRKPTDKQIMVALIVFNAIMTVWMAASFFLGGGPAWFQALHLAELWANGGITVALTRNYKDGAYG